MKKVGISKKMQKAGGADSKFKSSSLQITKTSHCACVITQLFSLKWSLCVCHVYSKVMLFCRHTEGKKKKSLSNHFEKPHEASHVLDLLSVCRRCVCIPESKRVVGLKPGFNSKTIQTNTPPPQPHPSWPSLPPLQMAIRSHRKLTLLALSTF